MEIREQQYATLKRVSFSRQMDRYAKSQQRTQPSHPSTARLIERPVKKVATSKQIATPIQRGLAADRKGLLRSTFRGPLSLRGGLFSFRYHMRDWCYNVLMNTTYNWYSELIKPDWAPPAFLFGPVWSVLYFIIFLTFGYVFYKVWHGDIPKIVALPFVLNLIFNLAFSPIQFGLQNNALAAVDIVLVLGTIIWAGMLIFPYAPVVVYANIPYLLWVSFATVLQFTVTYLNW
jgi:benzodiazapine receptor